jgi:hypothetical protein
MMDTASCSDLLLVPPTIPFTTTPCAMIMPNTTTTIAMTIAVSVLVDGPIFVVVPVAEVVVTAVVPWSVICGTCREASRREGSQGPRFSGARRAAPARAALPFPSREGREASEVRHRRVRVNRRRGPRRQQRRDALCT